MLYETSDILKSLAVRSSESRWGIGTASRYLSEIDPCFSAGKLCPTKVFSGVSVQEWQKAIKDSQSRLTYCDEGMVIDAKGSRSSGISVPNGILEFDHFITTIKKDRDGDIMDPMGATVDANMPLLWQHLTMQPIGSFQGVTNQDSSSLSGKSVILGTQLGNDAAILVEGGALRISHGFSPTKFTPVERNKDARETEKFGWHIHEYDVMEVSLVSVPANSEAVITAFSRGKLHSPLVKSWAKSVHDARPVQMSVPITLDLQVKVNGQPTYNADLNRWVDPVTKKMVSAPENNSAQQDKSIGPPSAKMMTDYELEGSFEWVSSRLHKTSGDFLRANNVKLDRNEYTWIGATFADRAIVCMHGSEGKKCWEIDWEPRDGVPTWTGSPREVEIKPTVIAKMLDLLSERQTKSSSEPAIAAPTEMSFDEIAIQAVAKAMSMDRQDAIDGLGSLQKTLRQVSAKAREYQEAEEIDAMLCNQ